MKNKIAFLTILVLLFSSIVFASQLENRAMKKGLRPMSMGGAFTAIADDDNAYFYLLVTIIRAIQEVVISTAGT